MIRKMILTTVALLVATPAMAADGVTLWGNIRAGEHWTEVAKDYPVKREHPTKPGKFQKLANHNDWRSTLWHVKVYADDEPDFGNVYYDDAGNVARVIFTWFIGTPGYDLVGALTAKYGPPVMDRPGIGGEKKKYGWVSPEGVMITYDGADLTYELAKTGNL